jgi:cytochrome b561|uniref:cytochrome b n=1 Tax=Altererythrobacter segetis TaxID=1104773 RepID=UPI00140CFF4C|nr:cytochrome b [Altererythrobacter segetis]
MPTNRYSIGAMTLHWLIAIAVIVDWRLADAAEHAPRGQHFAVLQPHFALGMAILVLTVLRLVWRLTHRAPPFSSDLAAWERVLARTVHFVFYVLLVGLPLMAWIGTSMWNQPTDFFGLFTIPNLPFGENRGLGHELQELHGTLGEVMLYLIVLHVLGALKHHFWDKDGNLYRMLPFGTPKP